MRTDIQENRADRRTAAGTCRMGRKSAGEAEENGGERSEMMQSRSGETKKDAGEITKSRNGRNGRGRKNIPILRILGLAR